jgi:heterodisulfide reductase subunit A-like polyferredoxin
MLTFPGCLCPGKESRSFVVEFFPMAAVVDLAKCNACGECIQSCPLDAITMQDSHAVIDPETCGDCGACVDACPNQAISV